jgi:hypothetical protein
MIANPALCSTLSDLTLSLRRGRTGAAREPIPGAGERSAGDALPPEGPVDPVCDTGIAINDEAGDAADEPSIDVTARLVASGDVRAFAMWTSNVARSSGFSAVKAAIRTDSGSRICSNKASRSESSTGRSATSATRAPKASSSDDQRGEHTSIIGQHVRLDIRFCLPRCGRSCRSSHDQVGLSAKRMRPPDLGQGEVGQLPAQVHGHLTGVHMRPGPGLASQVVRWSGPLWSSAGLVRRVGPGRCDPARAGPAGERGLDKPTYGGGQGFRC